MKKLKAILITWFVLGMIGSATLNNVSAAEDVVTDKGTTATTVDSQNAVTKDLTLDYQVKKEGDKQTYTFSLTGATSKILGGEFTLDIQSGAKIESVSKGSLLGQNDDVFETPSDDGKTVKIEFLTEGMTQNNGELFKMVISGVTDKYNFVTHSGSTNEMFTDSADGMKYKVVSFNEIASTENSDVAITTNENSSTGDVMSINAISEPVNNTVDTNNQLTSTGTQENLTGSSIKSGDVIDTKAKTGATSTLFLSFLMLAGMSLFLSRRKKLV